jgi:twitching motility protein PilU
MDLSAYLRAFVSQRLVRTIDGDGRIAAVEILINTPTIAERIFKGEFHEIKALMAKSRELGMRTFDWALFDLYNDGFISYEEALRNADSANELRLNIKLKSARGEPASAAGSSGLSFDRERTAAERQEELRKQEERRRELEEEQMRKVAAEKPAPAAPPEAPVALQLTEP